MIVLKKMDIVVKGMLVFGNSYERSRDKNVMSGSFKDIHDYFKGVSGKKMEGRVGKEGKRNYLGVNLKEDIKKW